MKKFIILAVVYLIITIPVLSQAPQSFKYQAIARNAEGNIISDKQISLRINLLKGSDLGKNVYSETHDIATSHFGLILLQE